MGCESWRILTFRTADTVTLVANKKGRTVMVQPFAEIVGEQSVNTASERLRIAAFDANQRAATRFVRRDILRATVFL